MATSSAQKIAEAFNNDPNHLGITMTEYQLLFRLAISGDTKEPGFAAVWWYFLPGGLRGVCRYHHLEYRPTLRAMHGLIEKNYLFDVGFSYVNNQGVSGLGVLQRQVDILNSYNKQCLNARRDWIDPPSAPTFLKPPSPARLHELRTEEMSPEQQKQPVKVVAMRPQL
jgi:hypothetical protein